MSWTKTGLTLGLTEIADASMLTVCVAPPVARVKFVSPEYLATIESADAGSDEVVQVACWLEFNEAALQPGIEVPLTVKETVPVGTIGVNATPESCAVKVTSASALVVFDGEADRARLGAAATTVWLSGTDEVLPVKFASPE